MTVPWETINEKLPYARNKVLSQVNITNITHSVSQDAYAQRKEMWNAIDINGNGYLSLAEVTKGINLSCLLVRPSLTGILIRC